MTTNVLSDTISADIKRSKKMPTKIKISKDMILDAAFEIVRASGMEKLSNRELANKLNCSIRPIYYQFENAEEMHKELYGKIEKFFYDFLLNNMEEDVPAYKQAGIHYIKFAEKEKNLFKILFMTETELTPDTFVSKSETGYKELEKLIRLSTKLSDEDLKGFHTKMWIFCHGIATLVANGTVKLTDQQIKDLLTVEFRALMMLEESSDKIGTVKKEGSK